MSTGKDICAQLRKVRVLVAKANNIPYFPSKCTYEGECMGTCPACDSELQYLTEKLKGIESTGTPVIIDCVAESSIIPLEKTCENLKKIKCHITEGLKENSEINKRLEYYKSLKTSYKEDLLRESDSEKKKQILERISIINEILKLYI